jgi:sarcosine oxidase subunit gamma
MAEGNATVLVERPGALRLLALQSRTILQVKSWRSDLAPTFIGQPGHPLPTSVGRTQSGDPRALCVGPSEWLLVWAQSGLVPIEALLEASGEGLAVVDQSAGLSIYSLSGTLARDVLSKCCGLDLDASRIMAGDCARTRLAHVSVVIDFIQAPDRFELYVPRSYARYVEGWLEDAAVEFLGTQ